MVETLESSYAIQNPGHLYELSPQQLISCDYNQKLELEGCDGGVIYNAFMTVKDVSVLQVEFFCGHLVRE